MLRRVNSKTIPLFDGNGCGTTKTVMTSTTKSSSSHSCKGACEFKHCNSHQSMEKPLESCILILLVNFSSSHNDDDNNDKEFDKDQDGGYDLGG